MKPLSVAIEAALAGGAVLKSYFGGNFRISYKGEVDLVTQADTESEQEVISILQRRLPDVSILAEESGAQDADVARRFIIDPLDGTTNFLHGIPIFSVSIALERNGEIVAGVVYNPAMDELYTAEKGGGAFMNDRRLRVAARRVLSDTVISTGVPHLGRGHHGKYLVELRNVMGEVAGIRRLGSVALDLAFVAAGRVDGFWEEGLNAWDIAAGLLLVREAGGFASDKTGGRDMLESGGIVAGNEHIHKALLDVLKKPVS